MGAKIVGGLVILVIGVGLGLSIPRFLSPSLNPYLPQALQDKTEAVEGKVVRKSREEGRLLLTVSTPKGALLSTFTKQIAEIDLLVEEGDSIMLGITHYEPFVKDPHVKGVMKPDMISSRPDVPDFPSSLDNRMNSSQEFSTPSNP